MIRTSDAFMASAVEAVEAVHDAQRRRAFWHATVRFVQLLATLPEYPAADFAEADLGRIRLLAEDVIARLEDRAAEEASSPDTQLALVNAIYDIRKHLENIDTWWRHVSSGESRADVISSRER